jgi:hypothetical protein
MALIRLPQGLLFPNFNINTALGEAPALTGATAMATTGNQLAMIGQLYIDGRAASKTLNTSGSSSIAFRTGTTTWANGSSSMDIGIQGVLTGSGPQAQPDGTFTVKATVAGGAGITTGAWNVVVPTTGSATLNHGDMIAVVFNLTTKAGSDSVIVNCGAGATNMFPICNEFQSGSWASSGKSIFPNVVITFSDGTKGTIDWTTPATTFGNDTAFASGTNPNERGVAFQLPWDCEVDGLFSNMFPVDVNSNYSLKLYADPLGTPSVLATIAVLAAQTNGSTSQRWKPFSLASPVALTRNTTYGVTILATGSSNVQGCQITWGAAGDRVLAPGGTTLQKITRNGSSGAFSGTTTQAYLNGVRICSFTDTASVGGGGVING